ncbi:hypothetical protein ACSTS3_10735 [Aquimarina muelleri]|uniref:hypothetical protein n=1 Tax=Aquimarina muelleri TaxID=279356 RepID=UPI003F6829E9
MDKILSPIKNRLLLYLENKGVSKSAFFQKTGISASNFKGMGMKSELGGDKIIKILTVYDDINPNWFIMGKGTMLKVNDINQEVKTLVEKEDIMLLIRYLLDNNKELLKNELFRIYIKGNIKLLELEKEKTKYTQELQNLKKLIIKKRD